MSNQTSLTKVNIFLEEKESDVLVNKRNRQEELLTKLSTSNKQYAYLINKFSTTKLTKMIKALDSYKHGYNASAPLICLGPNKCPFFHACPIGNGLGIEPVTGERKLLYDDINDFPVGDQCILERTFIEQKIIDYITEFDIDPRYTSELSLVNDLALIDLHKQRCILFMAGGDLQREGIDFLKVDLTYDDQGNEVGRSYKEHPVILIIEKLEKRRHKILEELLGTRRSKATLLAKIKKSSDENRMLDEIQKIREVISNDSVTVIDMKDIDIIEID